MDCIFCKIIAGEIPCKKVYEDDSVFAFHDIAPQAPVHIIVIPKRHILSAAELTEADSALVGRMFAVMANIAKTACLDSGFRIITNSGEDGAQTVPHLHFHLVGGRRLSNKLH